MKLKYTYWYFKSVLSDEFCKKVINLAKQKQKVMATIGSGELNKKTRDSLVLFLNDPIIYKTLHPYIQTANKNAEWNFQWDSTEPVQYTEYNKKQHYRWHQDAWDQPYVNPEEPLSYGKIRKISVSCSLNDSKKYKGGKLQFDSSTPLKKEDIITCEEILPKGSIVVFPSFIWHRVTPVTQGTRQSLVLWNLGKPYV
jgi:PKHD-type hydroxylase|tara:strand:- start:1927 stop:2517 length:591 start_codon:yes stop_codon:yes gene_type:complete